VPSLRFGSHRVCDERMRKVEVLKREGNATLSRKKGMCSNLYVELRESSGRMKMCGRLPANWHFPDTELGMRLAVEQFEHVVKGNYGSYKSRYI